MEPDGHPQVPLSHCGTRRHGRHPDPQEWPSLERGLSRRQGEEREPPRLEALRTGLSRKRLTGYHARSRAEAKMGCLKSFGNRIMARDPDRQTAEIHTRIALMNRFSDLGQAEITRVA